MSRVMPSRFGRRIGRALVLALCTAGVCASGIQAQASVPKVASVGFSGNEAFPDEDLQQRIRTRPSECKTIFFQVLLFCPFGFDFAEDARFLNRRRTIPDDISRLRIFYYLRGYRGAVVDTVITDRDSGAEPSVDVVFTIQENQPTVVDSLEIAWPEGEPMPDVLGQLRTRLGQPLDGEALTVDLDSIQNRFKNAGFAHVEVLRSYFIPRGELGAEVRFEVYPGPLSRIGPITVAGNEEVSSDVVLQLMPFEEGNTYRERLMETARRNLFGLDVFRSATIRPDMAHEPDSIVPINVQVAEGPLIRGRWGGGLSTADCLWAEASGTHRNFAGGARRLQLSARVSNFMTERLDRLCTQVGDDEFAERNWIVSADFTQPWIFSPRNTLTASLFFERQSLKDVFVRKGVGAEIALNRSLGRGTVLSLAYRPQRQSLDAAELFFCSSFLVCEPEDIGRLQETNVLSPGVLTLSTSTTDQLLNPTRGWTFRLELEAAGASTGSDFAYRRWVSDGALYKEVSPGWVLATRFRAGSVHAGDFEGLSAQEDGGFPIVHPQKRFFAGGANTVRGYSQNQLGPRVLAVGVERLIEPRDGQAPICDPEDILDFSCDASVLDLDGELPRPTGGSSLMVANAELRFPMVANVLQGAAFMDVGQVWPEGESMTPSALEWTPGFGVRYFSPIGPIRVDLGYRLAGTQQLQVVTQQVDSISLEPTDDLAILATHVPFQDLPDLSFRRVQFHLSIGQAF